MIYVQFYDEKKEVIISVFSSEQSSDAYKNLGLVEPDDPRYAAFYDSIPDESRDGMIKPVALVII